MKNLIFIRLFTAVLLLTFVRCSPKESHGKLVSRVPSDDSASYYLQKKIYFLTQNLSTTNPNHYFLRAKLYHQKEDLDSSLLDINQAIKLKQEGAYFIEKAKILLEKGQYKQALQEAQRADILSVRGYEIKAILGFLYIQTNTLSSATSLINKQLDSFPTSAEAHFNWGLLAAAEKDTLTAISRIKQALLYKPTLKIAYPFLSEYLHSENLNEAKEVLNEGLKRYPNFGQLWVRKGIIYQELNYLDSATYCYQKAYKMDTTNFDIFEKITKNHFLIGNYKKSWEGYQKLLQKNPKNVNWIAMAGRSLEFLGDYDKAFKYYELGQQLQPYHPLIQKWIFRFLNPKELKPVESNSKINEEYVPQKPKIDTSLRIIKTIKKAESKNNILTPTIPKN